MPQKPAADAGTAAKAKLSQPPPKVFPSPALENCRTQVTYECMPQMQAALTAGTCLFSKQLLSNARQSPEDGKRARDGACAGKLADYQRRYDEQERKPP